MLKLLDQKPFSEWKFLQRFVNRHRHRRRSGTDKYRTFLTSDKEKLTDTEAISPEVATTEEEDDKKSNPFHSQRLDMINKTESENKPKESDSAEPGPLRRWYSEDEIRAYIDDNDEIDTAEPYKRNGDMEYNEHQVQYNALSYRRSSKLRSSLREFKRKSLTHMDNVRETVRRKVTARKYANMEANNDNEDKEEIIEYDRSPGFKRKQVTMI